MSTDKFTESIQILCITDLIFLQKPLTIQFF